MRQKAVLDVEQFEQLSLLFGVLQIFATTASAEQMQSRTRTKDADLYHGLSAVFDTLEQS